MIDPDLRTVTVYQPNGDVTILTTRHELSGDDYLPGFWTPVARVFE